MPYKYVRTYVRTRVYVRSSVRTRVRSTRVPTVTHTFNGDTNHHWLLLLVDP
jgi:hypothetical protein